jgi:hypothetical protein
MRPSRERESRQKSFDKYVLSGGKERINKITKQKELFLACFVAPVMFSSSASCQGEFFRAYVNKAEIAGSRERENAKGSRNKQTFSYIHQVLPGRPQGIAYFSEYFPSPC